MDNDGTPQALRPIAEQVLTWVASERQVDDGWSVIPADDLRRIELCALAVIEWSMFHDWLGWRPPDGC
jgi:hypothetical protein